MERPAMQLTLPPRLRRSIDFRRDVMPIIERKCIPCHGAEGTEPHLRQIAEGAPAAENVLDDPALARQAYTALMKPSTGSRADPARGEYVHPGTARTSPLVWHIFGRNTSRPWDGEWAERSFDPIPPGKTEPLDAPERRTIVEWIDLGALWSDQVDE
jgi:hypothetical protein